MADNMREYYAQGAREYERIYERDDPVRQVELAAIKEHLRAALAGKRVIEVACGTGYWTQVYAGVARRVMAIDFAAETLAVAREKSLPPDKVEFRVGDAYAIDAKPGEFDAGVAMFWLSHIPQSRLGAFLMQFHGVIGGGATVVMGDNVYNPGVGGELIVRPDCEDTYKRRRLESGEQYDVLKNYYTFRRLRELLSPCTDHLRIHFGKCYWWITYQVRPALGRRTQDQSAANQNELP